MTENPHRKTTTSQGNVVIDILLFIGVLAIVFAGLTYLTSFRCLTDNVDSGSSCISQNSIMNGLVVIGLATYAIVSRRKNNGQAQIQPKSPNQPPTKSAKYSARYYKGVALVYTPILCILVSLLIDVIHIPGFLYLDLAIMALGLFGYITILPGFIIGTILMSKK